MANDVKEITNRTIELKYLLDESMPEFKEVMKSKLLKITISVLTFSALLMFIGVSFKYDKNEIKFKEEVKVTFKIIEDSFLEVEQKLADGKYEDVEKIVEKVQGKLRNKKSVFNDFSYKNKFKDESRAVVSVIDEYQNKYLGLIKVYLYNKRELEVLIDAETYKFSIIELVNKIESRFTLLNNRKGISNAN